MVPYRNGDWEVGLGIYCAVALSKLPGLPA